MTNFMTRMMIAAATLVVAAGGASAQVMKADIPFAFRAAGVVLPAGTYRVTTDNHLNGHPYFQIRSVDGGQSIITVGMTPHDPKKEWRAGGAPVLSFQCGTGPCALAEVWTGADSAYVVPRPKLGRDEEPARTAVVVMRQEKGE